MSVIGAVVLPWAAKKGAEMAVNKVKSVVINKAIEAGKEKAGNILFGQKLANAGEIEKGKFDFRGLQMYKTPKPGWFVNLFCGGSVIYGRKLDDMLKDQAVKSLAQLKDLEQHPENDPSEWVNVDKDEVEAMQRQEEQAPKLDPKDVKVSKPVNKPITIKDFRDMVTFEQEGEKRAKNKGYVRFEKCDGGNGVKLGKVGNKINVMSWRINVTKEHNRQMRMLFAETLLADFGGIDGIPMGEKDNSVFGARLQNILGEIRATILNSQNPTDLLARTTVRECLDKFDSIFTETNLEGIAKSFIDECLSQCQFTMPGKNGIATVEDFLKEYGRFAPEGMRTVDEMKALVTGISKKNGRALREALGKIADAFGKMNEVWQQDKAARAYLGEISSNPTSAAKFLSDKYLPELKNALWHRMGDAGNAKPNNFDVLNLFFDKAFPKLVDSFSLEFVSKRESGKYNEADLKKEFAEKLTLGAVLNEVKNFGKVLREKAASGDKVTPIGVVIKYKEAEKAAILKRLEEKVLVQDEEYKKLDEDVKRINAELAWLGEKNAELAAGKINFSEEFQQTVAKKSLDDKGENSKVEWTKDELMAILIEGGKKLDATFQQNYVIQEYLKERCPNIAAQLGGDVKEIMDGIVADFEKAAKIALAVNVRDKGDISTQDLIAEFGDYLMFDLDLKDLRSEETLKIDNDPTKSVENTRRTSALIFVESMMKTVVDKAVQNKSLTGDKYVAMLDTLKVQAQKMSKVLAGLFEKVKKEKLTGFSKFVSDVRSFQYKGAIEKNTVDAQRNKFLEGARQLLKLNLLRPFIEEDLPELLDETDETKFANVAKDRLYLRAEEAINAFHAAQVQQFYEGALHFSTSVDKSAQNVDNLYNTVKKDEDTNYSNSNDVARTFLDAIKDFKTQEKLDEVDQKRPTFRPIKDEELIGLINRQGEKVWRQNVVSNAPGRHMFLFIDSLISKVQDFLHVKREDRITDISNKWLEARADGFKKEMGNVVKNYVSFENRLVNLCRDEVMKALKDSNDPRFAAVRDPAVREQLLNDILGEFIHDIGAALKRYIETPNAFSTSKIDNTGIFGSDKKLAEFVRDTLGVTLRGAETDVKNTNGFKRISNALDRTIQLRKTYVEERLAQDKVGQLSNGVFNAVLLAAENKTGFGVFGRMLKDNGDISRQIEASQAIHWAVDRAIEFARSNVVDAYCKDSNEFYQKLAERALADLAAVSGNFEAKLSVLDDKLAELQKSSNVEGDKDLEGFATNERGRIFESYIKSFCDLTIARSKKGEYAANLDKLGAETIRRFTDSIEGAKKIKSDIVGKFYDNVAPVFDKMLHDGNTRLLEHGAVADVLLDFGRKAGEIWASLPERLNKKLEQLNKEEYFVNKVYSEICMELTNELDKLSADYASRLDAVPMNFTAECIEKLLATQGITRDGKDVDAFNATVKSLLDDPTMTGLFASAQTAILSSTEQLSVDRFGFVENSLKPVFEMQYAVRAAQNRVQGQINTVNDTLTRMATERGVQQETIKHILYTLNNEMKEVRAKLDVAMSVDEIDLDLKTKKLNPADVNINVEELIAKGTEEMDRQLELARQENARNEWLAANLGKIVSRAVSIAPQTFDANANSGSVKDMAATVRQSLEAFISGALILVLNEGTKDDWDQKLGGILGKEANVPLTEEECGLISPDLMRHINFSVAAYNGEKEKVAAEKAIKNDVNAIAVNVNKLMLVAHLPSILESNRLVDYNNLVKINPGFADPGTIFTAYKDKFNAAGEKVQKNLPNPESIKPFMDSLAKALKDQIDLVDAELTKKAKKPKDKWEHAALGDKAKANMAKATYDNMVKQLNAKKFKDFETMLRYMLTGK